MFERGDSHAPLVLTLPKTVELEQRLARAEVTIGELRESVALKDSEVVSLKDTIKALQYRVLSFQAQLDHLFAELGRY
jgi:uncharacterized coiled-coil protein SlyX